MKKMILSLLAATALAAAFSDEVNPPTPKKFCGECAFCGLWFTNTPISLKTNRVDPLMDGKNGYTNVYVGVVLQCPQTNCLKTNEFEWEKMVFKPRAFAVVEPVVPPKAVQPPVLPPPLPTNNVQEIIIRIPVPKAL